MLLTTLVTQTVLLTSTAMIPKDAAAAWSQILAARVKDGRVDYDGIAEEDRAKLDRYLAALADAKLPKDKNAALGLYFDAYNALVVKSVLDNGKPRSVLDVKGFFDAQKHKVFGQSVTLDELEKKIINPYAKDPRTHMVLVCGAVGCPILEGKPYYKSKIDKRMDAATRRYLATKHGAVVADGSVKLSKIFDWYNGDFGGPEGALAFVKKHLAEDSARKLGDKPAVSFVDYNWTLNQQ